MCIFTDDVIVANTQIFVAKVGQNEQVTVYSNTVQLQHEKTAVVVTKQWGDGTPIFGENSKETTASSRPTAMVLPIPLGASGSASSIKMVDMTANPDFFKVLREAMNPSSLSGLLSFRNGSADLEVRRCGPYSYSVVPDVESFSRLKTDVFGQGVPTLAPGLKDRYGGGSNRHAFLVCVLDVGGTYSPVAYVHPMMAKNKLFVPTLHEHGSRTSGFAEYANDWDHAIYSIDGSLDTKLVDGRNMATTLEYEQSVPEFAQSPPFPFSIDWTRLVRRQIKNFNPNGDIVLTAA